MQNAWGTSKICKIFDGRRRRATGVAAKNALTRSREISQSAVSSLSSVSEVSVALSCKWDRRKVKDGVSVDFVSSRVQSCQHQATVVDLPPGYSVAQLLIQFVRKNALTAERQRILLSRSETDVKPSFIDTGSGNRGVPAEMGSSAPKPLFLTQRTI